MRVTRRCIVSGRVQGVFYRATTRDKAVALGLDGRVRNLPDGRVEVIVSGPADRVNRLCGWLWQGSSMARVDEVICEDVPETHYVGFETR